MRASANQRSAAAARNAAQQRAQERRRAIVAKGGSPDVTELVIARRFRIGFTKSQLIAAIGSPQNINRTVTGYGIHEQWIYGNLYVYPEDGVVTAFQEMR